MVSEIPTEDIKLRNWGIPKGTGAADCWGQGLYCSFIWTQRSIPPLQVCRALSDCVHEQVAKRTVNTDPHYCLRGGRGMLLSHRTSVKIRPEYSNITGHMCYVASKIWNICNYERHHYKEPEQLSASDPFQILNDCRYRKFWWSWYKAVDMVAFTTFK